MDTDLGHFMIDDYLKRYERALLHLSMCAPHKSFDEVLNYIKKHELYREGMKLYNSLRDHYDAILRIYADYLTDKHQFADAGLGTPLKLR
jgi:elongator complex protein 1